MGVEEKESITETEKQQALAQGKAVLIVRGQTFKVGQTNYNAVVVRK